MKTLLATFFSLAVTVAPASAELVSTTVHELLSDPGKFHGRSVLVSGIWDRGFEWSVLTPERGSREAIWVDAEEQDVEHPNDPKLMLLQQLPHFPAADGPPVLTDVRDLEVEIEAVFEDWDSMPMARELKEQAKRQGMELAFEAYGHMGRYHQRLIVTRVRSFRCSIESADRRFPQKNAGAPGATDNLGNAQ